MPEEIFKIKTLRKASAPGRVLAATVEVKLAFKDIRALRPVNKNLVGPLPPLTRAAIVMKDGEIYFVARSYEHSAHSATDKYIANNRISAKMTDLEKLYCLMWMRAGLQKTLRPKPLTHKELPRPTLIVGGKKSPKATP